MGSHRESCWALFLAVWRRIVSGGAVSPSGALPKRETDSLQTARRLNSVVAKRADALGLFTRWLGLRVVAADASVLMPAVRTCFTMRCLVDADRRMYSLCLPGTDIILHANVYRADVTELNCCLRLWRAWSLMMCGYSTGASRTSGPG